MSNANKRRDARCEMRGCCCAVVVNVLNQNHAIVPKIRISLLKKAVILFK